MLVYHLLVYSIFPSMYEQDLNEFFFFDHCGLCRSETNKQKKRSPALLAHYVIVDTIRNNNNNNGEMFVNIVVDMHSMVRHW